MGERAKNEKRENVKERNRKCETDFEQNTVIEVRSSVCNNPSDVLVIDGFNFRAFLDKEICTLQFCIQKYIFHEDKEDIRKER